MPNPEVIYIQSPEGTDAAAMDAELMSFEEWWEVWGDAAPAPANKHELGCWWDRLQDQSDWQLCQRYRVGL